MKLKNINRGLVLGAVLIAGTVGWVIYDNSQFKDSKPEIQKTTDEFVQKLAQSNVGKASQMKDNWNRLITENFTSYTPNETQYVINADAVKEELRYISEFYTGEITKAESTINGTPTIKKAGSKGATVTFEYSTYFEVEGGSVNYLDFFGITGFDCESYEGERTDKSYKFTVSGEATVYFEKTVDGWKVGYMTSNGSYYGEDFSYIDDSETSSDDLMPKDSLADTDSKIIGENSSIAAGEASEDGE